MGSRQDGGDQIGCQNPVLEGFARRGRLNTSVDLGLASKFVLGDWVFESLGGVTIS